MMGPVNLLLYIAVITSTVLSVGAEPYCAKQNQTDKPRFTQKLGRVDNVRFSHQIAILCCAEGYNSISWYRLENNIWESFPPPPHGDDNTPELEEDGQILRILDAKLTDQTTYRCDVEGSSEVIQHFTDLIVIECDPLARGPVPTVPSPENKTIYEYGGNITLHCTGYFGCQLTEDWALQLALWTTAGKYVQAVSPRYSVQILEEKSQFRKQAEFTITNVNEEDTKRTFYCTLANPQEIHGQTITPVRITKKDKPEPDTPWLMIGLIIGGSVVFVIIVFIVVLCLRGFYGPQIRLYFSSRISALAPKTIDKEEFLYNLFIYHADEDERSAQNIKMNLQDRGYDVYIKADMGGNQHVMLTVYEKTRQSAMVLFLYSDDLRDDDLANFFLQSLITERKGKDILFLEVSTFKPEEVMEWTLQAKDTKELHDRNVNNRQLVNNNDGGETAETEFENYRSIAENDGVDGVEKTVDESATAEKKTEIVEDLKFWKFLPRIKLPDDAKNKRKMENFWCSLQNKIPKFEDHIQTSRKKRNSKDRNGSMNKPLLDNCRDSEPLTPLIQNVSPNSDDVFAFEGCNENEQHSPQRLNQEAVSGISPEYQNETTLENRSQDSHKDDIVRGEIAYNTFTGRDNELVCAADVHHRESSELPGSSNSSTVPKSPLQKKTFYHEADVKETTKPKSREEIFTMSDEEPKPGSFESESCYSEENFTGSGNDQTSDSGGSSRHELLSYRSSSGVSDLNSEGSLSPQNQLNHDYTNINASGYTDFAEQTNSFETTVIPADRLKENSEAVKAKGNGKLNLIIKPPGMRSSTSSTPESGYITTSPSERTISAGGFLPRNERKIDVIAEEQ